MKVVKYLLIVTLILLPIWAVISSAQKEAQAQNLALQPMTVNGSIYSGGAQPEIVEVKAFIGTKECGKVNAQRQVAGNTTYTYSIPVKSTTQEEGCGTNGSTVTFTVNNISLYITVWVGVMVGV